jgi:hypothetical protein
MKTKRFFLFGLSAVLLALGLVLAGCDDGSDDDSSGTGGGGNPFEGTWNGTATLDETSASATVTVTATGWTFVCADADMDESGTYTRNGNTATLTQEGVTFGTASISGNTLTVNITSGEYSGGTGTFTKN